MSAAVLRPTGEHNYMPAFGLAALGLAAILLSMRLAGRGRRKRRWLAVGLVGVALITSAGVWAGRYSEVRVKEYRYPHMHTFSMMQHALGSIEWSSDRPDASPLLERVSVEGLRDAWGTPLRIGGPGSEHAYEVVYTEAGPDGKDLTSDDVHTSHSISIGSAGGDRVFGTSDDFYYCGNSLEAQDLDKALRED